MPFADTASAHLIRPPHCFLNQTLCSGRARVQAQHAGADPQSTHPRCLRGEHSSPHRIPNRETRRVAAYVEFSNIATPREIRASLPAGTTQASPARTMKSGSKMPNWMRFTLRTGALLNVSVAMIAQGPPGGLWRPETCPRGLPLRCDAPRLPMPLALSALRRTADFENGV